MEPVKPQPQLFCPTCFKWLSHPQATDNAILYCPSCDSCLKIPKVLADRLTMAESPAETRSVSIEAPDTDAQFAEMPEGISQISELGLVLEVHRTPHPWRLGIMAIFLLIVLGAMVVSLTYGWWTRDSQVMRVVCGVACLAIGAPAAIILFFWQLLRPQVILVCEGGLARVRHQRVRMFPWNQVAFFEGIAIGEIVAPAYLRHEDGTKIDFEDLSPGSQRKLAERARQEVWQRLYPPALKVYEEGGIVDYGMFGVTKAGLVRKGKTLPWEQIARLKIEPQGKFVVRRRGSVLYWFAKSITRIPNFFILQALIERHAAIEQQTQQ